MTGTLVNVAGIVVGGTLGLLVGKKLPERITDSILKVQGLVVLIIALNGVFSTMLIVNPQSGRLSSNGGILLLVSIVVGNVVGELLKIDERLNNFGYKIEEKFGMAGFAKGFIVASLIFPIGAMSVIGAINDGLTGDSRLLIIKATLDFVTSIILASTLGSGVIFSAIPVFILQAGISLLSKSISPYITTELLDVFCMVGYTIVAVIGFNFLTKTNIKTANLLPALLVPIIYYFVSNSSFFIKLFS